MPLRAVPRTATNARDIPRIGLIGAECSGKSVLADALAQELHGCVVHEVLRTFVAEHGRPPRRDEQVGILAAQRAAEDRVAAQCPGELVVADPAPLMTAIYSRAYFDDDSLLDAAVADIESYDLVVWCGIDLPWVPDEGQRDGPEQRARVDSLIAAVVRDRLEPAGAPLIRVHGPVAQRVGQVQRAWQPRGPKVPT